PNAAECNRAMIPLQKDRAWFGNFIVDLGPGRFIAFDVVVNLHSIESDRDLVADNGRFGCLPIAPWPGDEFVGRFEIVDGAASSARAAEPNMARAEKMIRIFFMGVSSQSYAATLLWPGVCHRWIPDPAPI